MDSLIKQTRARFAAGTRQESKEESGSARDRKIPPQRTQPFKEKKRSQSWIRRQFSSQMSWDNEFSADYPTAVAAAAYAIQSLEESRSRDQKEKSSVIREKTLISKIKSKEKDTRIQPEPPQTELKPSDETSRKTLKDPDIKVPISTSTSVKMPQPTNGPDPPINRRLSFSDSDETFRQKPENPVLERPQERAPFAEMRSTFADKPLSITDEKESEPTKPIFDQPFTKLPAVQPDETRRQNAIKPRPEDSMADAWLKEEMASIKERYEKLKDTIDNWEASKKRKARRELEKKEGDPSERKRQKAFKNYHEDIARIEAIAGGARAQAEENRRKEEYKVKEKANKIRSTGKIPATCLCF